MIPRKMFDRVFFHVQNQVAAKFVGHKVASPSTSMHHTLPYCLHSTASLLLPLPILRNTSKTLGSIHRPIPLHQSPTTISEMRIGLISMMRLHKHPPSITPDLLSNTIRFLMARCVIMTGMTYPPTHHHSPAMMTTTLRHSQIRPTSNSPNFCTPKWKCQPTNWMS